MAQSIFAGGTSYDGQSLNDILNDIEWWLKYTTKTKEFMSDCLIKATNSGFWKKTDDDFKATVYSALHYYDTITEDLNIIKDAIINKMITEREIKLLHKIGKNAFEYNREYPKTYKRDYRWHDYGNPDFEVVEDMYAKGRDYFVTLLDASNMTSRLEDYMQRGQVVHNSINIGGNVQDAQFQLGTINSSQIRGGEKQIDYNEILAVLDKIKQITISPYFEEEFAECLEEFKTLIEEATEATSSKESPEKIQAILAKIKNISGGIGTGIIANGIFKLLESLTIFKV